MFFLKKLFSREFKVKAELERIAQLQRAAADRRAEYAAIEARGAEPRDIRLSKSLSFSRKQMQEAETAYMTVLQTWENKQSRQKSH